MAAATVALSSGRRALVKAVAALVATLRFEIEPTASSLATEERATVHH
jgi:hypothetical protein